MATDLVDEMYEETIAYYHACKAKYGNNLVVVCAFNANVSLPRSVPGLTGHSILPPLRSHKAVMQQRVLGWMQNLGVKAVTTFGQLSTRLELWTCGIARRDQDRSQIDYIAASELVNGYGGPINFMDVKSEAPLLKKMDHRPLRVELSWTASTGRRSTPVAQQFQLPKQTLMDKVAKEQMQKHVVSESFRN